jgi:hypothetical protein
VIGARNVGRLGQDLIQITGAPMSWLNKVARFASSPQGQKVIRQAKKYASDPKNKQKIDQLKNRFMGKGKGHH